MLSRDLVHLNDHQLPTKERKTENMIKKVNKAQNKEM